MIVFVYVQKYEPVKLFEYKILYNVYIFDLYKTYL